ncbi:hypothetical protein AB1N83_011710 [Pleurotus pulmonarius]
MNSHRVYLRRFVCLPRSLVPEQLLPQILDVINGGLGRANIAPSRKQSACMHPVGARAGVRTLQIRNRRLALKRVDLTRRAEALGKPNECILELRNRRIR